VDGAVLLEAYAATTWRIRSAGGSRVVRIGQPSPLSHCGILTAHNPASRLLPRAANRTANRRLLQRLQRLSASVCPAVALGLDPGDRLWREPGFAVRDVPLGELVRIGASFGQNAIVWIDASGIPRLVVTRTGFCGEREGSVL
jgi:hypothetical protein